MTYSGGAFAAKRPGIQFIASGWIHVRLEAGVAMNEIEMAVFLSRRFR